MLGEYHKQGVVFITVSGAYSSHDCTTMSGRKHAAQHSAAHNVCVTSQPNLLTGPPQGGLQAPIASLLTFSIADTSASSTLSHFCHLFYVALCQNSHVASLVLSFPSVFFLFFSFCESRTCVVLTNHLMMPDNVTMYPSVSRPETCFET